MLDGLFSHQYRWICQLCELLNVPNQEVIAAARESVRGQSALFKIPNVIDAYDTFSSTSEPYVENTNASAIPTFSPWAVAANEKLAGMECSL